MNPLLRYWRFNLVGAMGMVVQLAALATINHCIPGHYLCATAVAIELALLHNFVWHLHYTWRDHSNGSVARELLRFHLTNGLVSMVGNLVLMRMLVHSAHMAPVMANLIAIVCCSVANFSLGCRWVFAPVTTRDAEAG